MRDEGGKKEKLCVASGIFQVIGKLEKCETFVCGDQHMYMEMGKDVRVKMEEEKMKREAKRNKESLEFDNVSL